MTALPLISEHPAATFSADRAYRYTLDRIIGEPARRIAWVMLNPSTADEATDDPTIRRCIGFSRAWGYGRLRVVNLFALRATDPKVMKAYPEPVGPLNDQAIVAAARWADLVMLAWGAHGSHLGRGKAVIEMLPQYAQVRCLAQTKSGEPAHPLYLRGNLAPIMLAERERGDD